jgi:hypothetical protein
LNSFFGTGLKNSLDDGANLRDFAKRAECHSRSTCMPPLDRKQSPSDNRESRLEAGWDDSMDGGLHRGFGISRHFADSNSGRTPSSNKFRNNAAYKVDWNRETERGLGAGNRVRDRVDADKPTTRVKERAPRISRVCRRVGLNHIADLVSFAGRQLPIQRANTPIVSDWSSPKGLPIAKAN